jgi:tetratricopeptide (TPR) repeat protein
MGRRAPRGLWGVALALLLAGQAAAQRPAPPPAASASALQAAVEAALTRGLEATRLGKAREAEAAFRQALKLDPRNRDARYNLALVYYSGGDYARAEREFAAVVALDPAAADARVGLGMSQYALRKYSQAAANLKAYVAVYTTDAAALLTLARSYAAQRKPGLALPYLRSASVLMPRDPAIAFELGKAELAAGNVARARNAFTLVLGLKPDSLPAAAQLGRACLAAGDYPSALRVLEPLASYPSPPVEGLKALALTYDALKRADDALRVRSDLAALLPPAEAVPLRLKLGQIHAAAKRWPEAYEQYRAAVGAAPGNVKAVASLAAAASAMGSREEAAGWWQEATRLAPTNPAVWLGLSGALLARPDPAGAQRAAAEAVRLDATNLTALRAAAEAARSAGDLAAAETYLRRILARDPASATAREAVVDVLEQRGQLLKALLEASEALRAVPPEPAALLKVADLAERVGNPDLAMTQYRRLLESGGRYEIPAALELGRLLVGASRVPEALTLYRVELGKHAGSPPLLMGLARAYQAAGQDQAAVETLSGLIGTHPQLAPARVSLAESLAWTGHPEEALRQISTVLADPPVTEDALRAAVLVYKRAGRPEEAVAAICRLLPDEAPDQVAAELIAGLYRDLGRPGEGAQALDDQYAKHADHPVLGLVAGRLWAEAGNLAQAETLLQLVATEADWREPALTTLARALLAADLPVRALQVTQEWLEGDLACAGLIAMLAELAIRPDLAQQLAPVLSRMLEHPRGAPGFWEAACEVVRYFGRSGAELARVTQALGERPGDAGLSVAVALLALETGRPQVAQRAVEPLAGSWDCDRAVAAALSRACAAQGLLGEAVAALQPLADRGKASAEDYAWLGGLLVRVGKAHEAYWEFCHGLRKSLLCAPALEGIRALTGSHSITPADALEGLQYVFYYHPEAPVLYDLARELARWPEAREAAGTWLALYGEPLVAPAGTTP